MDHARVDVPSKQGCFVDGSFVDLAGSSALGCLDRRNSRLHLNRCLLLPHGKDRVKGFHLVGLQKEVSLNPRLKPGGFHLDSVLPLWESGDAKSADGTAYGFRLDIGVSIGDYDFGIGDRRSGWVGYRSLKPTLELGFRTLRRHREQTEQSQ